MERKAEQKRKLNYNNSWPHPATDGVFSRRQYPGFLDKNMKKSRILEDKYGLSRDSGDRDCGEKALPNSESIFNKRIWRIDDVAKFLGCSKGHVYNLSSDEKIPKIKKGKFLYFIPSEILEWLLQGDFYNERKK